MSEKKPSCLILGAGGFLGTNLCRRLVADGYAVRGFGRSRLFPEAMEGIDWHQGDLRDTAALAGILEASDIVFHLAHASTPQSANLDAAEDLRRDVIPSLALLDLARRSGVSRVVFVSSGGTIYGVPEQVPTPESAPTEPITAYGIAKLAIEKYLALYERLHGLDYRVLRVTNPFGPYQTAHKSQGIVAALVGRAFRGERMEIWGDGSAVRDFIYVDDVVDALEAAATDRSDARIFNIGTGQGRSLRDVIHAVERQLGRELAIDWRAGRASDVPVSIVSIERAREKLGWAPKWSFEAALAETIDWWKRRTV